VAGAPGAKRTSMGLALAMVPVGVPLGKVLLLESAFENSHDQWSDRSRAVIEPAQASSIVRDPPRAAGTAGKTPRINEFGVSDGATPDVLATKLTWV
jgi:hypothetical protein